MDFDLRNDEERGEQGSILFEQFLQARCFGTGMKVDFCFEAAADRFCGASLFEGYQNGGANLREALPLFGSVFGDSASERLGFWEQRHVNAFWLGRSFRQVFPDFFRGENENRRGEADERAADSPDGGLRRTARFTSRRLGVEAILQHVEIESAEV